MRKTIYILDGYNLIHRIPRWKAQHAQSLERGREALLAYCRKWIKTRGDAWLFYVVFDGDSSVTPSHSSSGKGVRVLYSKTGETADDKILDIIRENGENFNYVVVSDDRYVYSNAHGLSAEIMTANAFASVLSPKNGSIPPSQKQRGGQRKTEDLNDKNLSASEQQMITESLMREWNV